MDKTQLIDRFWTLIEPSIDGYSRAIGQLLDAMPAAELQELVSGMEDPEDGEA